MTNRLLRLIDSGPDRCLQWFYLSALRSLGACGDCGDCTAPDPRLPRVGTMTATVHHHVAHCEHSTTAEQLAPTVHRVASVEDGQCHSEVSGVVCTVVAYGERVRRHSAVS